MKLRACVVIALLAGCGGSAVVSDSDSGAQGSSGMINKCDDAVMPGGGISCDHYCATFMSTCSATLPGFYDDLASCLSKCHSFSQPQICCRGYHADLAATTPSPNAIPVHCPHAAGQQVCD